MNQKIFAAISRADFMLPLSTITNFKHKGRRFPQRPQLNTGSKLLANRVGWAGTGNGSSCNLISKIMNC